MSEASANPGFRKAEIPVQRIEEYRLLHGALERLFAPGRAQELLERLRRKGIRVRDWEAVLERRVLESLDGELKQSGKTARELYQVLAVSDQGLIRESYLTKLEEVGPELRRKYNKIYVAY